MLQFMFLRIVMLVAVIAAFAGCPQPPITPPTPDSGDAASAATEDCGAPTDDAKKCPTCTCIPDAGDLADQVCNHISVVPGCQAPAKCAATFRAKQGVVTDFDSTCILAAKTSTALLACGSVGVISCPKK